MIPYRRDRKRKDKHPRGLAIETYIHKADRQKHGEDALQDIHPYSTRESIYIPHKLLPPLTSRRFRFVSL